MSKRLEEIQDMQDIMNRLDVNSTATSHCCPSCGARFPLHYTWIVAEPCTECGKEVKYSHDLINRALPEFTPLEKISIARGLTYYHWTLEEHWIENLPPEVMAHLGCKQAAFERARDALRDKARIRSHQKAPEPIPEGFVYRVKLNDAVPFEPFLRADEEDCLTKRRVYSKETWRKEKKHRGSVERYVNVMEAPGSISLCATPEMFTIVERLSARDAFGDEAVNLMMSAADWRI